MTYRHALYVEPRAAAGSRALASPIRMNSINGKRKTTFQGGPRWMRQAIAQPSMENPAISIGLAFHEEEQVKVHEETRGREMIVTLGPSFSDQLALGNPS